MICNLLHKSDDFLWLTWCWFSLVSSPQKWFVLCTKSWNLLLLTFFNFLLHIFKSFIMRVYMSFQLYIPFVSTIQQMYTSLLKPKLAPSLYPHLMSSAMQVKSLGRRGTQTHLYSIIWYVLDNLTRIIIGSGSIWYWIRLWKFQIVEREKLSLAIGQNFPHPSSPLHWPTSGSE